ncbi:hypothetical protein [Aurantimonas manganoxydans]|uniref:hypothetical protein n=1 Tax=Aurantimonas manganoxydans TaxID=651183 RepID=UPI0002DA3A90|nr:hypothetical protein [Aurantimonas manganoxydans]
MMDGAGSFGGRMSGLEALVVVDDPLVAAFIEDVLLGRDILADCISLPAKLSYLLRRHYDVAVVGVDAGCRYLPMVVAVLRRRRIPTLLFSAGGDLRTFADEYPYIATVCFDPETPDFLGDHVLRVVAREGEA